MLAALTLANRLGNKTEALSEASGHLDALRIALRLAKRLTFLPKRAYAALSETIDEVGRMLGGWLKHEQANPQGEESSEPAGAESSKGKKPESRKRIFGVADLWGRVLFHAFTCKCLKQEPILLLPQLKRPSIRRNRND